MSEILNRRLVPVVVGALAAFAPASAALAQASADPSPQAGNPIVIRNVHVIPMDTERVEAGQTVVIRGDRIVAIGPAAGTTLPDGATVIDGAGQYLLPGLTDGHVHLESWAGSRPDFGDAALYLAHGVTTVINLRGTPTFLDWKRRVQAGELIGPTIHTAGELIIGPQGPTLRRESGEVVVGPNAITPADIELEVARQVADGVDAIKYYGGLTRPAYLRMAQVAREEGVPLVGHRPLNLGIGELLEARQSLAHVYMLSNLYFWPISSSRGYLLASVGALAFLLLIVATWWRPATRDISRARLVTRTLLLAVLVVVLLLIDGFTVNLAGLEGTTLLALLTAAAAVLGIGTMGREQEFGSVAVGMRADLLLVEENPLQNLETLKQPVGVMVRGRWFARHELQGMMAALRTAER